jgi:peptide/nickel transport system permease protein
MTIPDYAGLDVPEIHDGLSRRPRLSAVAVLGGLIVALVAVAALVSFVWTPNDPYLVQPSKSFEPPSREFLLGTDQLGRDILSRILVGARTTLFVGTVSVGIGGAFGTILGLLTTMVKPRSLRIFLTRTSDFMLSFPAILLAIIFVAAFGGSTATAMMAIGIATIPVFARMARGATLQVLASEYVAAARVSGRTSTAIAIRHVFPNISSIVIVQASVTFAMAILAEAALSYLGLGTAPPIASWGRMLQEAQGTLFVSPLVALWPGASIALAVLGFNLLGDGLRDRLDPRLQER